MNTADLKRMLYRHAVDLELPVKDSWWIEPPIDAKPLDIFEEVNVTSDEYIYSTGGGAIPQPGPITLQNDNVAPFPLGALPPPPPGTGAWTYVSSICIPPGQPNAFSIVETNQPAYDQSNPALQGQAFILVEYDPDTGALVNTWLLTPPAYIWLGPPGTAMGVGGGVRSAISLKYDSGTGKMYFAYNNYVHAGAGLPFAVGEVWIGEIFPNGAGEAYTYAGIKPQSTSAIGELHRGLEINPANGNILIMSTGNAVAFPTQGRGYYEITKGGVLTGNQHDINFGGGLPGNDLVFELGVSSLTSTAQFMNAPGTIAAWDWKVSATLTWPLTLSQTYAGNELGFAPGNPLQPQSHVEWNGYQLVWMTSSAAPPGFFGVYDPTTLTWRFDSRAGAPMPAQLQPFADYRKFAPWHIYDVGPGLIQRYLLVAPFAPVGGGVVVQGTSSQQMPVNFWGVITHIGMRPKTGAAGAFVMKFDDGFSNQLGEFPGGTDAWLNVNPNEFRAFGFDFSPPDIVRLESPIIIPTKRAFRILVRKFNAAVADDDVVVTAYGWQLPEPDNGVR